MDRLEMKTCDLAQEKIRRIGELFPGCVTEAARGGGKTSLAVDFDALRQELSDCIVEGPAERYQFTWPDKSKAKVLANSPTNMTLRPCREESVDFDSTKNLYIEGDNLEVLKILRETYLGKVKMIYIDPPYNTGNDFVYNDDFSMSREEYISNSGQSDEEGNRLVLNTEANGRFHTDWLNMIYPRLKLAKDFLSDDGVIFISIDSNEISNLKKICDEIFGESNFIDILNWKGRGGRQDSRYFARIHEYILCYAKSSDNFVAGAERKTGDTYPKYDITLNRRYKTQLLRKWGSNSRMEDRPNLYYPILAPDGSEVFPMLSESEKGRWRWSQKTMEIAISDNKVEFLKQKDGKWIPYEKVFEPSIDEKTKKYTTWIDDISNGTLEIKTLFGKSVFDYPKSTDLMIRLLSMANVQKNDFVCDFFSGSGTMAHAVMLANNADNGNRKFILVQMPEAVKKESEAFKQGYSTVCDIGKERLYRAGQQILKNNSQTKIDCLTKIDCGFRVFKLDSSNMKDVFYSPSDTRRSDLDRYLDNIKEDRTGEDLLFQVMLELGIEPSAGISVENVCGREVYSVDGGYLIACFDTGIDDSVMTQIAKRKPYYFVMRDESMLDDSVAVNFDQIFRAYSPDTVRKVLRGD